MVDVIRKRYLYGYRWLTEKKSFSQIGMVLCLVDCRIGGDEVWVAGSVSDIGTFGSHE